MSIDKKQPVKETGIMFSTVMVQAYQQGLKTVTRRTWGLEKINKEPDKWRYLYTAYTEKRKDIKLYCFEHLDYPYKILRIKCPYGGKGDVLRVKETWYYYGGDEYLYQQIPENVVYKADKGEYRVQIDHWRPSIFMFRWASRYFLPLIADPIPERLQNITPEDAADEGAELMPPGELREESLTASQIVFAGYWDSINGKKYPWSMNPWEWPLRFERFEGATQKCNEESLREWTDDCIFKKRKACQATEESFQKAVRGWRVYCQGKSDIGDIGGVPTDCPIFQCQVNRDWSF